MAKSLFITGTDTGAGKTFVAAALARAFKKHGMRVGVMKPVETGCRIKNGALLPKDAARLKKAAGSDDSFDLINPYRFAAPLSPSVASRMAGTKINHRRIKQMFSSIEERNDVVIVEGAGGLFTPLTDTLTMADLAGTIGAPLLIVVPNRLGCINHTLLTLECARLWRLKVNGVILSSVSGKKDLSSKTNAAELTRLGAPVKCEVPYSRRKGDFDIEAFINAGSLL